MSDDTRYSRSQKFRASTQGAEAIRSYEAALADARTGEGQAAFEAARAAWATPRGLKGDDALLLVEFGVEGLTISDAAKQLEDCGMKASRVKESYQLLMKLGLLEATPRGMPVS